MTQEASASNVALMERKFRDPLRTADGSARARVPFSKLDVLWFNTGTLCNLACANCYIESSPRNNRLVYLSAAEVTAYLDEIVRDALPTTMIGFTGGEPFMNIDILAMVEDALARGFQVLVLTNAMKPMYNKHEGLLALHRKFPGRLQIRVSVDHHTKQLHETERGADSWAPMIKGLRWLMENNFTVSVAGRLCWGEDDREMREGYRSFFQNLGFDFDVDDHERLVLFPEMDPTKEVPEITEQCWATLGVARESVMCSYSRMVVKRRGDQIPTVLACTLIPYDRAFELGATLRSASCSVALNHSHCASFCVLGGATCGAGASS